MNLNEKIGFVAFLSWSFEEIRFSCEADKFCQMIQKDKFVAFRLIKMLKVLVKLLWKFATS